MTSHSSSNEPRSWPLSRKLRWASTASFLVSASYCVICAFLIPSGIFSTVPIGLNSLFLGLFVAGGIVLRIIAGDAEAKERYRDQDLVAETPVPDENNLSGKSDAQLRPPAV